MNRLRATGYRRTLEVELRLMKFMKAEAEDDTGKYDFTMFLPEFREN